MSCSICSDLWSTLCTVVIKYSMDMPKNDINIINVIYCTSTYFNFDFFLILISKIKRRPYRICSVQIKSMK